MEMVGGDLPPLPPLGNNPSSPRRRVRGKSADHADGIDVEANDSQGTDSLYGPPDGAADDVGGQVGDSMVEGRSLHSWYVYPQLKLFLVFP